MNLIVCLGIVSRNRHVDGGGNTVEKVFWSSYEFPFIADPAQPH